MNHLRVSSEAAMAGRDGRSLSSPVEHGTAIAARPVALHLTLRSAKLEGTLNRVIQMGR